MKEKEMTESLFTDPMQAIGFDEMDLKANRNGRMTAKQKRYLLSLFGLRLMAVLVGLLIIMVMGAKLIPQLGNINSWELSNWLLLIVGLMLGLGSIYAIWQIVYDLFWGKCKVIIGHVTTVHKQDDNLGIITNLSVTKQDTGYHQEFEIYTSLFVVKQGSLMCVYFSAGTRELIGLEYAHHQIG